MALMVNVTDGLEIVAGRNYVLSIDRKITAAEGEHCLQILRDRFPSSQFVLVPPHTFVREDLLVQGGPVTKASVWSRDAGEEFVPYGENGPEPMVPRVVQAQPHVVTRGELRAALSRTAVKFPPHTETNRVLSLLLREMADPQSGDGAATPPAEQPPTTTPAATGAGTADESATGNHPAGAAPSPSVCACGPGWKRAGAHAPSCTYSRTARVQLPDTAYAPLCSDGLCGAKHPMFLIWCSQVEGHTQLEHSAHDVRGSFSWNSEWVDSYLRDVQATAR